MSLLAACLSSLSLGIMVIFDKLMMSDCYGNRPNQAWIVSSAAGAIFGLFATLLTWIIYISTTSYSTGDLFTEIQSVFWPRGMLMLIVGIINIQVMRYYFSLFTPDKNGLVNETSISMWLASTPVFIFIASYSLSLIPAYKNSSIAVEATNFSFFFAISVLLASVAMIGFEKVCAGNEAFRMKRLSAIIMMILCIIFYNLLSSAVLQTAGADTISTIALLPFYWLGFAAGTRVLFFQKIRVEFFENLPNIKKFLIPILVIEVIGMIVYYFEFFALSNADPVLVNLIIGAHIMIVFIFSLGLGEVQKWMFKRKIKQLWFLGLSLTQKNLPHESISLKKLLWFSFVVLSLSLAISQS